MPRLRILLRNLLRRERIERELDDELRATLAALVADHQARGLPPNEAERRARLELGSVESVKEQVRQVRAGAGLDILRQDLRYAVRLLRRAPLFTATAALSLAVGIGATTTIFSIANALLLRAAAGVAEPDRLVDIGRGAAGVGTVSYRDYVETRDRARSLTGVYAYPVWPSAISLRAGDGAAERIYSSRVTTNYFTVLGAAAARGRLFDPAVDRQDGSAVVVLSHRFWVRRFERDPLVVGATLRLNGDAFTVIGVAAEGFQGTTLVAADVWTPLASTSHPGAFLRLGGRLRPGVEWSTAAAELEIIGRSQTAGGRAGDPGAAGLRAAPSSLVPGARAPIGVFLTLLMVLVGLLLLTACVNLAGVSLARATARRREMAVRIAIGAGRGRLLRQLLTETALLFLIGGAAGLVLTRWMTAALVLLLPSLPFPVDVSFVLDWRVLLFTAGVSLMAAVLSGLAPALHASRTPVMAAMNDDSRGSAGTPRLRHAFVMTQIALSLVLVVVGGLIARAAQQATTVGLGFDPDGVELAALDFSIGGYTETTGPAFARQLVERVRALPGVTEATLAFVPPGGFEGLVLGGLEVAGLAPPAGEPYFEADWNTIEPGYFSTLRIPLRGRDFTAADRAGSAPVAIVTERTARRFWPSGNAVGQPLRRWFYTPDANGQLQLRSDSLTVVGVAGDVSFGSVVDGVSELFVYVPMQQHYLGSVTLMTRSAPRQRAASEILRTVAALNPDMPIVRAQALTDAMALSLVPQRIAAFVAGSLGLVGVWLAAIGIYGVTTFAVARRTREIGVRMALGAQRLDILGIVLRQGIWLVGAGVAAGLVLAAGAGRVVAALLAGVRPWDPVAIAAALLLFVAVGLAACFAPAFRATRLTATEALRHD